MKILDGKKLNKEILEDLKSEILGIKEASQEDVSLVILQTGNDPASNIYIKNKIIFAEKIGAKCEVVKFDSGAEQLEIIKKIEELNNDQNVNGMILQLPISEHLDKQKIINVIKPEKDVDGLGVINLGKLVNNDSTGIIPATARGIVTLLKENNIEILGKEITILGRSVLVGKSVALNLINNDATVSIYHSKSKNLDDAIKNSDIIISATGQNGIINCNNLRENQVFVDVGISIVDGRIKGDIDIDTNSVGYEKIQALSPVPGGVGPMTVASLFQNLLQAYKMQNK